MPAHVTPNVSPVDDLADQFKRVQQRLASLERAISGGSGGGSGTDEVFVGPDDPIATTPSIELWYDSDAPSALNPNVAWGHMGSYNGLTPVVCAASTLTYLTTAIPVTLLAGRKYRLHWSFRAVGRTDNVDTPANTNIVLYDGTTSLQAWVDHWHQFRGNWSSTTGIIYINGDGVARSLRLGINSGVSLTIYPSMFGIEDVGPTVRTAP